MAHDAKGLALAMAGLMTLGGVVFGLEGQLQWRNPIDPNSKSAGVVQDFPGDRVAHMVTRGGCRGTGKWPAGAG